MADTVRVISIIAIPAFIVGVLSYGFYKGVNVYDTFVEGAKEGLATAVRILPYLVAMLAAIGIFRASGAMEYLTSFVAPLLKVIGMPSEVLPLAIMRPLSGMASIGLLSELLKVYGSDSFIGRVSSTMMGSTETTFYTLSIYFGSVGIKSVRYALAAALIADLSGMIASVIICSIIFA